MKYELTTNTKTTEQGVTLYQIKALKNIERFNVKIGDVGGFVESVENLSQQNDCWIFENSDCFGSARISGNACVFNNLIYYGDPNP